MSRIGKQPINIPGTVEVAIVEGKVTFSGPKGKLSCPVRPEVEVLAEEGVLRVVRKSNSGLARALHGTTRAILANAATGVELGYERHLIMEGLGYRARVEGGDIVLEVGFSHPHIYKAPEGIEFRVEGTQEITVSGVDKELVGRVAAELRAVRPPEPYKGKGIRYVDEIVRRKAGKTAGAGGGLGGTI